MSEHHRLKRSSTEPSKVGAQRPLKPMLSSSPSPRPPAMSSSTPAQPSASSHSPPPPPKSASPQVSTSVNPSAYQTHSDGFSRVQQPRPRFWWWRPALPAPSIAALSFECPSRGSRLCSQDAVGSQGPRRGLHWGRRGERKARSRAREGWGWGLGVGGPGGGMRRGGRLRGWCGWWVRLPKPCSQCRLCTRKWADWAE